MAVKYNINRQIREDFKNRYLQIRPVDDYCDGYDSDCVLSKKRRSDRLKAMSSVVDIDSNSKKMSATVHLRCI